MSARQSPPPVVIDLSHSLAPGMPCYPGTEPPTFTPAFSLAEHGFVERRLTLLTHTGTHVDTPAHMLPDGKDLDAYPATYFVGRAVVLDVSAAPAGRISDTMLRPHARRLSGCDYLLLYTSWSDRWGEATYVEGYPALTPDAARWLCDRDLRGVGIDAVSIDPAGAAAYEVHRILLERGLLIVENLTNLGTLRGREFLFACLPLKIAGADGAPVRAVALVG
ncbi:MAG: cyclase family protein [Candidatus Krumholzibacteria bacterium]|nr:cyclase family protein [Candidatus Krumholzibacteria bacterium]